MTQFVRLAQDGDLGFLRAHDRHPPDAALVNAVESGRVMVLDIEGAIHGWLRWSLFWDEHPFLNMISIFETDRSQGLGSTLLDVWEREMRERQYSRVLTSTASDERSQRLYRRRGYIDAGVLLLPDEVAELLLSKAL